MKYLFLMICAASFTLIPISTYALPENLTEIGLTELMNLDLRVTTATRKSQKLSETSAALYVISSEDIRRSGARHVAELLRLAPGVEVSRIDSNTWAVSIRGFNQTFTNQILVLVDGRIVFTPLFSGTFWENLSVDVNDIDKIEVIRGPGASVWGANAVNGVINIVTKNAFSSKGERVEVGGGTHERYFHSLSTSKEISDKTAVRFSHQLSNRAANKLESGGDAQDDWRIASGAFRLDTRPNDEEELTVLADGYYMEEFFPATAPSFDPPYTDSDSFSGDNYNKGASTSIRYKNELDDNQELRLHSDYIYEERNSPILPLTRHSLSSEVLYDVQFWKTAHLTSGVGFNWYSDNTEGNFIETLEPESRDTTLINGFLQLEKVLADNSVRLLGGVKIENNDYSGTEFMPTARIVVQPTTSSSVWASFSRAASTPGRVFEDTLIPIQVLPGNNETEDTLITVEGSSEVTSTILNAYEIGVRQQFSHSVFADLTLFYFDFNKLLGLENGMPRYGNFGSYRDDISIIPLVFGNKYDAYSYGGELSADWAVQDNANLSVFYSFLNLQVTGEEGTLDSEILLKEGNSPEHSSGIRVSIDPYENIEFDSSLRYVDSIAFGEIPGYWELDTRIAFNLSENSQLIFAGRDLLHNNHLETQGTIFSPPRIRIERSFWGSVVLTF